MAVRYFGDHAIICNLSSTDKFDAIHELISRTQACNAVGNLENFEHAVVSREREYTTGIGHGVAVAHGKSMCVSKLFLTLGISKKGISFQSYDEEPVKFLFLVGTPPGQHAEYLFALSLLIRVVRSDEFRRMMYGCDDPDIIADKLNEAMEAGLKRRGLSVR